MTDPREVQLQRWHDLVSDVDSALAGSMRVTKIANELPAMLAEIERLRTLEFAAREYREFEEVHASILGSEARDLAWADVKAVRRQLDKMLKEGC